jgi:hypothetical protein
LGPRVPLATTVVVLAAAALAACTASPVGTKVVTPRTETARTPTTIRTIAPRPTVRTTSPAPAPTADPAAATAVHVPCGLLVPASVATDFRKGYRPVATPVVRPGTDAARIHELGGTVCDWKDASTGHVVRIGVAKPGPKDLLALQNDLVDRSNAVPTYRVEGYFRPTRTGGISDAFPGGYWVHAASQDFYEPGDAISFLQAVQAALPKG